MRRGDSPLHVLVNRQAGGGGEWVAERLRDFGAIAFDPGELDGVLEHGAPGPADRFVLAGGDGSVCLLLEALRRRGVHEPRIALLPVGTGNDLARSLGWTGGRVDPRAFAEQVADESVEYGAVCVWEAGGRPFVSYMSVGVDAAVIACAEQVRRQYPNSPRLRKLALAGRALGKLGERVETPVRLSFEGGQLDVQGKGAVVLTNGGYFGAGSRVGAPNPSAPELSVTVLQRGFDLVRLSVSAWFREAPLLPYVTTSWARFDGSGEPAELDGEAVALWPCDVRPSGRVFIAVPQGG